jgi:nicotinamidase-related amidase
MLSCILPYAFFQVVFCFLLRLGTPWPMVGQLDGGIPVLTAKDSLLVVIDVQGKLAEAMCDREELFENICRLAKSAKLLDIPILVTEQLPDKLGPTRKEIADPLAGAPFITKSSFSCCGEPKFIEALKSSGKKQVVLCGIEAHICVTQTALELLTQGFAVYLVADAVSSRSPNSKQLAIERMRHHGAEIITTEMALFEWLRDAAHPSFREVRKLLV